jgi:hypothetical protein
MTVTVQPANRDSSQISRDRAAVTVSRAGAEPTAIVTVSRCVTQQPVTRDSDRTNVTLRVKDEQGVDLFADAASGCDSDSPALRCEAVTVTPSEKRTAEHKARLAADPRFAAWVAR